MTDTQTTLLVAESDDELRHFLVDQFAADGFELSSARGREEARVKLAHALPDLLLLGELEEIHGQLALLRDLRARGLEALPVVIVSSDRSELAELRALREGADDYVTKPASYSILLERCRALLRRARGRRIDRLRVGALLIDAHARRVEVAGRQVELSRLEFEFLSHLASEPTSVHTKWELLRDVWGYQSSGRTRTVDAHACRLRRKLALAGAPNLIVNVRGVGYRLGVSPVVAIDGGEAAAEGRVRRAA